VNFSDDKPQADSNVANNNVAPNGNSGGFRRLQGRDSFRHLHQKQAGPAAKADNLNIDNCYLLKGQMRRLVTWQKYSSWGCSITGNSSYPQTEFSIFSVQELLCSSPSIISTLVLYLRA
jgi:hypothetical protein